MNLYRTFWILDAMVFFCCITVVLLSLGSISFTHRPDISPLSTCANAVVNYHLAGSVFLVNCLASIPFLYLVKLGCIFAFFPFLIFSNLLLFSLFSPVNPVHRLSSQVPSPQFQIPNSTFKFGTGGNWYFVGWSRRSIGKAKVELRTCNVVWRIKSRFHSTEYWVRKLGGAMGTANALVRMILNTREKEN